jgi:hypothetical protein
MEMFCSVFGKNVEDMSREELIAAVKALGSLVETMNDARDFGRELAEMRPTCYGG